MNFVILDDKIITSEYVLDIIHFIQKADIPKKQKEKVLFDEFQKVVLQTKCTFGFTYTNNSENALRGRIGNFSGFRHGTQRLDLIPSNKWPRSRSKEQTCLRYWDFGRDAWRSFKKDRFVIGTSFWNIQEKKWVDSPNDANITSNWNIIKRMNELNKYIPTNRPDTASEIANREKINKREMEKRNRQIQKQNKRINKGFDIVGGLIKIND